MDNIILSFLFFTPQNLFMCVFYIIFRILVVLGGRNRDKYAYHIFLNSRSPKFISIDVTLKTVSFHSLINS